MVGTFSFFQASLHCSWTDLLLSVDYNFWNIDHGSQRKVSKADSDCPPGEHLSVHQALTIFHLSQAPQRDRSSKTLALKLSQSCQSCPKGFYAKVVDDRCELKRGVKVGWIGNRSRWLRELLAELFSPSSPHLSHIVFHDVSHLLHLCLSSC